MAQRKIVRIDEELCDGCGVCVPSCAEGALQIIDGKAKLVSEVYCDGLGACLGECPQGAISIEEREADEFDEQAVADHMDSTKAQEGNEPAPQTPIELPCGCPGSALRTFTPGAVKGTQSTATIPESALSHWPIQIKLVPVGAPFLKQADLLICADCVPFSVPDFHSRYLQGRALLVGCPKLDDIDLYRHKLKEIFSSCDPRSITVLRMEVPCCGGITHAVVEARNLAAPRLPVEIHTIGIQGGSIVVVSPAATEGNNEQSPRAIGA
jgi:NAD-dependent dihydropyrimidine dehydrogenase PreA subunit